MFLNASLKWCLFLSVLPVILSKSVDFRASRVFRIAGGVASDRDERPFQAAVYSRAGPNGALGFCGGALLSQEFVLSAAHCLHHEGTLVDVIQVVLGAYSLYERFENGRRIVPGGEVSVHPDWDLDTFAGDLALVRLATPVQFTENIQPIQLPYLSIAGFNFAGQAGTASGWGIAAEGVPFVSPTLRLKQLAIMTDTLCNSLFSGLLPSGVVCGFSSIGGGTCKGDNGGPLTIWHNETETTILIGIASFVEISGCNTELPSVFTRVQNYLDWIADITSIQLV